MKGFSASMFKGLNGYWPKRRGYERLSGNGRRRMNRAELGRGGAGASNRRRRPFWRVKITPRLRFSPKKFLVGLRDAYVGFMLRLANGNTRVISSGYGGVVDNSMGGFGRAPLKEYDQRMIIEIYKCLVAVQGQLVPPDAARINASYS